MEWRARFAPDGTLVTLTVTGVARIEGFTTYLDGVLGNPAWYAGTRVLMDFRDLDLGHLSYTEVQKIVDLHAPYLARIGNSPIAVIVSRPLDFGLVRMWELLADEMFPVHRVFYDVEDALLWLRSHAAGDGEEQAGKAE